MESAVIGSDLLLDRDSGGRLSIFLVADGHARPLGTFAGVADAWRAVDELDAPASALAA
jgi:hypothetical protein